MDLPDLMKSLMARGERVHCHRFAGQWLDIGRVEDYADAVSQFEENPGRFDPAARG